MPYFERKPYDLMSVSPAQAGLAQMAGQSPGPGADPSVLDLAQSVLSEQAAGESHAGPFRSRQAAVAGQSAMLVIGFEAEPDQTEPLLLDLSPTDLRAGQGANIPRDNVVLTPARLRLGVGSAQDVTVRVTVPAGTSAGVYAGHVDVRGSDRFRIAIEIEVIA